jgi:hypothetical protein
MQRLFFATADDLLPVFERVESKHRILYTLCGLFASRETSPVSSGTAIPSLHGPALHPNAIVCPAYLVTPSDYRVTVREVPQASGGVRYAVDQLANPDSITVQAGGIFPPDVLLHGRVASASSSSFSTQIYRAFTSAITKHFRHIRAFYVGAHAHELWERGYRLTPSAQSPKEYDLAI